MEFYSAIYTPFNMFRSVSIPNGMEFYANYSSGILAATEGFNSQRDGILRPLFALSLLHEAVSIPNGMEFYSPSRTITSSGERFNSQRDGILLNAQARTAARYLEFQFPTGWNSTFSALFRLCANQGFNSQRDGILLSFSSMA